MTLPHTKVKALKRRRGRGQEKPYYTSSRFADEFMRYLKQRLTDLGYYNNPERYHDQ